MRFDTMYVDKHNMVCGEYNENITMLFDNIYFSQIGTDIVTGEQIVCVTMDKEEMHIEKIMPRKEANGENIAKIFRAYGFRCTNVGMNALDEWLMFYAGNNADRFECYQKIGFFDTIAYGRVFCYPGSVHATYIGDKKYCAEGERKQWVALVKDLHTKNPMIALPLAIGLSAPIISRLRSHVGTENLLVSLSGLTSTGKTTTLKLMASMWGKPFMGNDGLLDNMNTTLNALQSKLNEQHGAPVFLDETSSNKNIDYQQMVYELSDGIAKARANSQGEVREQATWSTTIIFTTEGSIVNSLETAGSKARLLEVPIKFYNDKESVEKVKSVLAFCYGHIAKIFLKKLAKITDEDLVGIYRQSVSRLYEKHKGEFPEEYYRMLDRMALIDTTAQVMKYMKSFKFLQQEDYDAAYDILVDNYKNIITDDDIALWEILTNKILENTEHFVRVGFPKSYDKIETSKGCCYGRIDYTGGRYVAYVMTNVVKEWLKLTNAEAKNTFSRWKNKGLLVHTDSGRTQYRTSIQGQKVYTYVVEIEADNTGDALNVPLKKSRFRTTNRKNKENKGILD